jgi:hypothetical protein
MDNRLYPLYSTELYGLFRDNAVLERISDSPIMLNTYRHKNDAIHSLDDEDLDMYVHYINGSAANMSEPDELFVVEKEREASYSLSELHHANNRWIIDVYEKRFSVKKGEYHNIVDISCKLHNRDYGTKRHFRKETKTLREALGVHCRYKTRPFDADLIEKNDVIPDIFMLNDEQTNMLLCTGFDAEMILLR